VEQVIAPEPARRSLIRIGGRDRDLINREPVNQQFIEPPGGSISTGTGAGSHPSHPGHTGGHHYHHHNHPHNPFSNSYTFIMHGDMRTSNDLFMTRHYYWSWELINLDLSQRQAIQTLQRQLITALASQRDLIWRFQEDKKEFERTYNFFELRRIGEGILIAEREILSLTIGFQQAVFDILTNEQRDEYRRIRGGEHNF